MDKSIFNSKDNPTSYILYHQLCIGRTTSIPLNYKGPEIPTYYTLHVEYARDQVLEFLTYYSKLFYPLTSTQQFFLHQRPHPHASQTHLQ